MTIDNCFLTQGVALLPSPPCRHRAGQPRALCKVAGKETKHVVNPSLAEALGHPHWGVTVKTESGQPPSGQWEAWSTWGWGDQPLCKPRGSSRHDTRTCGGPAAPGCVYTQATGSPAPEKHVSHSCSQQHQSQEPGEDVTPVSATVDWISKMRLRADATWLGLQETGFYLLLHADRARVPAE